MKYFKPELLARCRSLDDDVADAAAEEWEQAIIAYRDRIRAIRLLLPSSVRRLMARYTLHDAKILTITVGKDQTQFSIFLRLEGTPTRPGEVLELNYHAVGGPQGGIYFIQHEKVEQSLPDYRWILYNEIDLDEKHLFFTHSFLLTGGSEIGVRFHSLRVRRLDKVLFSPVQLPEVAQQWPLVEA